MPFSRSRDRWNPPLLSAPRKACGFVKRPSPGVISGIPLTNEYPAQRRAVGGMCLPILRKNPGVWSAALGAWKLLGLPPILAFAAVDAICAAQYGREDKIVEADRR